MRHKHSKRKIIVAVVCAAVFFALVTFGFGLVENILDNSKSNSNDDAFSYSDYEGEQVYYNGAYYAPKKNLDTLLILGIDASDDRPDSTQSDFIALLILDRDKEAFSILHINRDTMADIPRINNQGESFGSVYGQLALAHTYGADERARCRNTVNAIETLLYEIEIENFISMTMDVVATMNDSIGGVTVQLLDDFTFLDPTFTKGSVVTLHGEQALSYVRARGALEDSSNLSRMERQKQYFNAFFDQYKANNADHSMNLLMSVMDYVESDCTVDQLSKWSERITGYSYNGVVALEGEAVVGSKFMEYHLDEQATRETIINLFYDPIK